MDDCILREVAVFQIFNKIWTKTDEDGYIWVLRRDVIHALDDIPAADVRPVVRGRWEVKSQKIRGYSIDFYKCSVCGNEPEEKYNFCPQCGADMREAENGQAAEGGA